MYIDSPVFLLGISIIPYFVIAETSNDLLSIKRAPAVGFHGMRGKKDITAEDSNDISGRAPLGLQDTQGSRDSIEPDGRMDFLHRDFDKRALMGFQGMRGKKDYAIPESYEDFYTHGENDKRAPMGFQGMRGKKTAIASVLDEYYKRAPMGFQGMRGKKSLEEVLEEIENNADLGRVDFRGKKTYLYDMYPDPDEYEKRARMMGFYGMRGKREDSPMKGEKRAPLGFQSMRGKRNIHDEDALEKRVIVGFQGMRGKKYYPENQPQEDIDYERMRMNGEQSMDLLGMREKRNAWDKVYGTRAKIETGMSMMGDYQGMTYPSFDQYLIGRKTLMENIRMRGKKIFDRSNIPKTFIAVKGKRSIWDPIISPFNGRANNKRVKNQFIAVRGKRSIAGPIPSPFNERVHDKRIQSISHNTKGLVSEQRINGPRH